MSYDKKIDMNKEDPELILGRMRCLEALGEWYGVSHICCEFRRAATVCSNNGFSLQVSDPLKNIFMLKHLG